MEPFHGVEPWPFPYQGNALPTELKRQTNGAAGRNRPCDLSITNRALFQLSYNSEERNLSGVKSGVRTHTSLIHIQGLYRLSYVHPSKVSGP